MQDVVKKSWIEFDQSDKYSLPNKINKKSIVDEVGEEKEIYFSDQEERIEAYQNYIL